ncbi:hypothetical protein [Streptomyces fulvoviolaceus]|uniref:hypothetical protein n=1 Tax=Streptomyces fulvoviolaceus TaxID=285535 RepID=UPI0021BE2615|nr:hypothetical protein [Streptomyces fulvoviolaceus]MCT9079416.1 hypothetical protein [Streptomyces fulvoviolaceus]
MALSTPRRTSVGRVAAAGLAAAASLALLGAADPAAAAPSGTASDTGAKAVVGKAKYGKWTKVGKIGNKCRVYVVVSAGTTLNGVANSECKKGESQVVVVGISINNNKIKYTKATDTVKNLYTKVVKEKNPKGKQTLCAFGYVNSTWDDTNPVRSEAKVCVKA